VNTPAFHTRCGLPFYGRAEQLSHGLYGYRDGQRIIPLIPAVAQAQEKPREAR
jgi:hypothetical protein